LFFLSSCLVAFEIQGFGIFCKIGLYHIVGIHDNDLGWKRAMLNDATETNKLTVIAR
jgi:hypothetical protein